MKLRSLFDSDVTRNISPVVHFHEQSPDKLAEEVGEYIITGGHDEQHPHRKRVPSGIHEQYVRLLAVIASDLDKPGGPELPASWISGFYGSGKSCFAKLFGLALDGATLPDGRSLEHALLARDTSPRAPELHAAFHRLRAKIEPIAVVFNIGDVARNNEHIHTAAVRMIQRRLRYCADPHVAEMELELERDGHWEVFEALAARELGRSWSDACQQAMADDDFSTVIARQLRERFSIVIARQFPERYTDPMAWLTSRAGTYSYSASVKEASRAIADMLRFRAPNATLFIVIDEVSQYVHQDTGRMLMLQSFVSELGPRHKGKVWLLVTGLEKPEEGGDAGTFGKMKDRFPEKLRVHLAVTNIRDVVQKRLLGKTEKGTRQLRALFHKHRNELRLFAYDCDAITEDDFVEFYPLLPGHIDLILQITSALRTRSNRSQGDDQSIRGLLQLLGELFRRQGLADREIGTLITLDQIYEVQHTALDSDIWASMARILHHCTTHDLPLGARAARAVALLELVQERLPTDAQLVAACLYDRLDRGNHQAAVAEALEELRRANLLGYSEKQGYKIQSSSGGDDHIDVHDRLLKAGDAQGYKIQSSSSGDDHIDVHDRLLKAGDALFERILMYARVDRSLFPPPTAELAMRVVAVARLASVTPALCARLVALLDEHALWTHNETGSPPPLDSPGGREIVTGKVSVPARTAPVAEIIGTASLVATTPPGAPSPAASVHEGARNAEEADERLAGMKRDVAAVLTARPRLIQPLADRLDCRRAPDVIADRIFERKGSDVVELLLGVWDAQSSLPDGQTDCQAAHAILCIVLPYVPDWRDDVDQVRTGKQEIVLSYSSATIAEAVMAGGAGRHCSFEQKAGAEPYGKWAVELPSDAQTATFTSSDRVRDSLVEMLDRQLGVGGPSPDARLSRVRSALRIRRNLKGPYHEQRYLLFRDAEHPEFLYALVRTALQGDTGLPGLLLVRLHGSGGNDPVAGIEDSVRLMLQPRTPR